MKKAVSNVIDDLISTMKYDYLSVNGYERMTAKRKADFENVYLKDSNNYLVDVLSAVNDLYKML
jgi:hypothetical protein